MIALWSFRRLFAMASAQQLIGLIKSHAEGDEKRFFDLAMQLVAAEGSCEGS